MGRPALRAGLRISAAIAAALLVSVSVFGSWAYGLTELVADAGPDLTVDVGDVVEFRGLVSGVAPVRSFWFLGNGDSIAGGLPVVVEGATAEFRYEREGVYETILHVYDGLGRHAVDTRVVTVRNLRPIAVLGADVPPVGGAISVDEDEVVTFEGSGSADSSLSDTLSLTFEWDFGDGTAIGSGKVIDHSFPRSGDYLVTLTVQDPKGAIDVDRIVAHVRNVEPEAGFILPTRLSEDEPFTASSQGTSDTPSDFASLRYLWSFGDGTFSTGPNPVHAYARSGTYDVTLTVTDDDGTSSSATADVRVLNIPPGARFEGPVSVPEGSTALFDASGTTDDPTDRSSLGFAWDFDADGIPDARGFLAANSRSDDSTYTSRLLATDDDDASDAEGRDITVFNVAPEVSIVGAFVVADFTFRLSGKKGREVTFTIFEGMKAIAQAVARRSPGSPEEQTVVLNNVRLNIAETITVRGDLTPPSDGQGGSNPASLKITFEDRKEAKFKHVFKAKDSSTWVWRLDLSCSLVAHPVHFLGWMYDPGRDDVAGTWDFGDGTVLAFASPSTGTSPRRILHEVVHAFPEPDGDDCEDDDDDDDEDDDDEDDDDERAAVGPFTVRLTARDDDGGLGSDIALVVQDATRLAIDNVAPLPGLGGSLVVVEDDLVTFIASPQDTASHEASLQFVWDFGDGAGSASAGPVHGYARSGKFLATVTVTDPGGETSVDSLAVRVLNRPPAAAVFAPAGAVEDQLVRFDGSSTEDTPSDRPALRFRWSFSDGLVGTGAMVERTFPVSGRYSYELLVQDDNGATSTFSGTIAIQNIPPRAVLSDDLVPLEDIAFAFDAAASSDTPTDFATLRFEWRFGDGTTGTGVHPVHRYLGAGAYTLQLDVVDAQGSRDSVSVSVSVGDPPPIAHVAPSELLIYGPVAEFVFEGFGFDTPTDQASLQFSWDFGDGSTGSGQRVAHRFPGFGTFAVTLTVSNHFGSGDPEIAALAVTSNTAGATTDVAPVNVVLDSDLDGLPDLFEIETSGTDPLRDDTDGDRIVDFFDVFSEEALGASTDPLLADKDFDGLTDWEEIFGIKGFITNPSEADTDGDGLTDGSELTTIAFKTTQRFAFEGKGDAMSRGREIDLAGVFTRAPVVDLVESADARVGISHPRSGDLRLTITAGGHPQVVRDRHGGAVPNVFDSFDLAELGLTRSDLGAPRTWTLTVENFGPDRGFIEYFEVHIVVRTNPTNPDSDGDGLNDREEFTLGTDGWLTDVWAADTDGDGIRDDLEALGWKKVEGAFVVPTVTPVAFDAVATGDNPLCTIGSTTWSHPQGASANLVIVAVGGTFSSATVTYAGVPMTQIVTTPFSDTPQLHVYYLNLAAPGANAIVVTPSAPQLHIVWGVSMSFSNAVPPFIAGTNVISAEPGTFVQSRSISTPLGLGGMAVGFVTFSRGQDDSLGVLPTSGQTVQAVGSQCGAMDPIVAATGTSGTMAWSYTSSTEDSAAIVAINAAFDGFRTDPTRADTDRDSFPDGVDLDPLHDLMVRLTIDSYVAVDRDPDCDDGVIVFGVCVDDEGFPEPFIGVEYRGTTLYTPHEDPPGIGPVFNRVYTLDVLDHPGIAIFDLQAWDDDLGASPLAKDKQWDISPDTSCSVTVVFDVLTETTDFVLTSGEGSDGDGRCHEEFEGNNADFDAKLVYRVDTVRVSRINTIFVDSLDVDDLVTTDTGGLRYLGDQAFYVAWVEVTSPGGPFDIGLNAVIVPRPQFLNSSANHTLRATEDANGLPDHLKSLTVTALDDASAETTNAIVGVLHGTLTGDEAVALLEDLRRGRDHVVNGGISVVTEQLVTLGLADDLVNAIPFASIRFDGDGTEQGPGSVLGDFFNAFVGAVVFVAQGLVLIGNAIAQFFEQAGQFLHDLGMAVIGAIQGFLGAVAEAVEKVGEVLAEFVNWIGRMISDFIAAAFASIISALAAIARPFAQSVADAGLLGLAEYRETGRVSQATANALERVLLGDVFTILLVAGAIFVVLLTLLLPFTSVFSFVIGFAAGAIAALVLQSIFALSAPGAATGIPLDPVMSLAAIVAVIQSFADSQRAPMADSSSSQTPDSVPIECGILWAALAAEVGIFATILAMIAIGLGEPTGSTAAALAFVFALLAVMIAGGALGFELAGGDAAAIVAGAIGAIVGAIGIVFGLAALRGANFGARIAGLLGSIIGGVGVALGIVPVKRCA